MKLDTSITFLSERLKFIVVSENYKYDIFSELTDNVAKFLPFIPTYKIEDTQGFIDYSLNQLHLGKDITLVATDRNSGEFIGCCGIHDICEQSISLGIWIKESASGKGYGSEIIKALEHYVMDHLPVEYLIYNVEKNNQASIKIAEKLGYIYNSSFVRNISETKILNMLQYRKVNPIK